MSIISHLESALDHIEQAEEQAPLGTRLMLQDVRGELERITTRYRSNMDE